MDSLKSNQPYTFDRVVRLLIGIFSTVAIFYAIYWLRDALLPFLIAWVMAYMLNPIVQFLARKLHLIHSLAVVLTLLIFIGFFVLLGIILVPMIETELLQINSLVANYDFRNISKEGIPVDVAEVVDRFIDFKELQNLLSKDNMRDMIQDLSPTLKVILNNTLSLLLGLTVIFLICLYLIFILLDYQKINDLWHLLIPPRYRATVFKITADVERTMNSYFRHQFLICCIIAAFYAIGFQIIGLPLAIVFGLFVGFVHMIPYLQIVTFPPALLLCWLGSVHGNMTFWGMVISVIIVYLIVQVVNDLFLTPKIMGKAMGLNPAIILLSLSVWGSLLGIIGMIIALPVTTLMLSYYKEFISKAEADLMEEIVSGEHSEENK